MGRRNLSRRHGAVAASPFPGRLLGQQSQQTASFAIVSSRGQVAVVNRRSLLQIILDFLHGPDGGIRFVLSEFLAGATLPQQIPALIQRLLELREPGTLLVGAQIAGLPLLPELVFLRDQAVDLCQYLVVVHPFLPASGSGAD